MKEPIVSLCLPTNGIIEWVFPALDSIYSQNVDESKFEVVVTNNGTNEEFHELMLNYASKHKNLIYNKNDTKMFYNQLEALKLANGLYLKFVNHRGIFTENSLQRIIDTVNKNKEEKPVMYFSNGALEKDSYELSSFDQFIAGLGRYISWTTGVGIWKSDYQRIPNDVKIDKISPHSCILFSERKKSKYLIENFVFSKDISESHENKGKYDLFKAFAIEEYLIVLNLYVDGDISSKTLKSVKKDYRNFVAELYWMFMILKKPCSYDLSGFKDSMGIFFTKREILFTIVVLGFRKIFRVFRFNK